MLPAGQLGRALRHLPVAVVAGDYHRVAGLQYLLHRLATEGHLGILNAIGSILGGGRFNLKGRFEVLYLGGDPATAYQEARTFVGRRKTPIVHVGVNVHLTRVLDLTDPTVQDKLVTNEAELVAQWRFIQAAGGEAPTQVLGRVARNTRRFSGFLSYSAENRPDGRCLSIFVDRLAPGELAEVTDESGTLTPERLL